MQWFRWVNRVGAIDGWQDFTQALHVRFGPSGFDDLTGQLTKLIQTTNVHDYQENFENLPNQTEGLNEAFMISCFVAGLKKEIWLGVQMFRPSSLTAAISLA